MIKFITLGIGFFIFSLASAQSSNVNMTINMTPANPNPGEQINFTLQSFSFDVNRLKITWLLNGVEKQVGIGLKNYSLTAGTAGQANTIEVLAEDSSGNRFSRDISFTPAGVDLIYEPITYTPPFYKGRTLNVNQGDVLVVAFPEIYDEAGRKYNTHELSYTWKKDGTIIGSASGLGKNYFFFSGTVPVRDVEIEVIAVAPNQNITANKTITIPRGEPKIVFYENSPVFGLMLNRAIKNNVQLFSDEFSAIAVPYYFSVGYATTPNLSYEWSMNNHTTETQDIKNIYTVRQETKGSGLANISLKINNIVRIFQLQSEYFNINFTKE